MPPFAGADRPTDATTWLEGQALRLGVGYGLNHVTGSLVFPNAEIHRVPQPPAARPVGELHLNDDFGPNPGDGTINRIAGHQKPFGSRRRHKIQARPDRPQFLLVKPGPDAAGVMEISVGIIISDMQSAEAGPASPRRCQAEHNELVTAAALHLHPGTASPGPVGRRALLADDALQTHRAGAPPHRGRVAGMVVAVAEHTRPVGQPGQNAFGSRRVQPRRSHPFRWRRSNP